MPTTPIMPAGTVTFLFTDIEGSTKLWEEQPAAMQAALARHDALLREAIEAQGGYVFKTVGDAFYAAFPTAPAALDAALSGQRALHAAFWGALGLPRVRMALHTGVAELRGGDYFGLPLNRVARLLSAGHGGQILLSLATQQLARDHLPKGTDLKDLGEGAFKGLIRPERVYQLLAPDLPADFPPIRALDEMAFVATSAPADLATEPVVSEQPLENPYKGLRAFQEADAHDFFGREALTQRLSARLAEETPLAHFLAVVGPSGSGKSSVVRAGLAPAVRRGALPGSQNWLIVEMIPGAHPLEELEAALLRVAANPPASLMEQLQADDRGLIRAVKRALPSDEQTELVLIIDQFEEVFTLVEDEAARVHFLSSLCQAVSDPRSRIWVVMTLRADFYDRPLLYPDPGELVRQRTEVVLPLSVEELYRAINGPAKRVGLQLEEELVTAIIKDVGEQPGALPLLQYALTELFERREGRALTLKAYQESGGVLGALSRRAEELYGGLTKAEQDVARQVFLRMVTLGEGVEDTRRRVRLEELESLTSDGQVLEMLHGVLELFGRYRLVTFDRDPVTQRPTVEVAHEALLKTWERMREWLDDSREGLRVQRRLMSETAEWANAGKDRSYLATGTRLAQFEALAEEADLTLNQEEVEYLRASVAERERQEAAERERQAQELILQKRAASRLRYLVAGMAVFLIVAAGLAVWALNQSAEARDQRQQAQNSAATAVANKEEAEASFSRAEAQRLAAEANVLLQARGSTSPLIALLAIRSLRTIYSPEGDAVVGRASALAYPRLQFTGHTGGLRTVTFSQDGKLALTSSGGDNTARLWDAQTGQPRRVISYTAPLLAAALSPDGRYVLAGSSDRTARLWDAATGQEVRQFLGHTGRPVFGVAFSPDGKQALTAGGDKTARLWDAATGQEVRQFLGHTDMVLYVAFSPDGKQVLTGSDDDTARLWDAATGQPLQTFSGHTADLRGAVFAPDGKTVFTGSFDGTARLWDAQTGEELRQFVGHSGSVRSVAFAPDGKTVLTGGLDDRIVKLWDIATGRELRAFAGHTDQVNDIAFSPDGQSFVTAGQEGIALLWSVMLPPAASPFSGHTAPLWSVSFSPDSKYLLTTSLDGTARLWDTQTRAEVRQFAGATTEGRASAALSPDGKQALTANDDGTARLWDTQTGAAVMTFTTATGDIYDADFAPDGKGVITSEDDGFGLWDAQTGQELRHFTGPAEDIVGNTYGFSPDGTLVIAGGFNSPLLIWDMAADREVHQLVGPTNVTQEAVFSPDGKYVLGANLDGIAWLWDAQTGEEVRQFVGHTAGVFGVAFSPDGKQVLTGSVDKTARLWDAQTGQELRRFGGHTDQVNRVAFSPDGRQIATGSKDGTARLWNLDYQDSIRDLCGRLVRDFTDKERAQFNISDKEPTCP